MFPNQRKNYCKIFWKQFLILQLVLCFHFNNNNNEHSSIRRFVFVTGSSSASSSTSTSGGSNDDYNIDNNNNIALLGLGGMGIAVVKCLSSNSIIDSTSSNNSRNINVWNRGEQKRINVQNMNLSNVVVHTTIQDTIKDSTTILTMIDDWIGTTLLVLETIIPSLLSLSNSKLRRIDYTIVLFSTYTPYDIKLLNNQVSTLVATSKSSTSTTTNFTVTIIGGAIVGVPQTICTPNAYIITSSDSDTNSDIDLVQNEVNSSAGTSTSNSNNQETLMTNIFTNVGTHIHMNTDIGVSSLYNIGLIHTITFGIVGHELIQLILQQYCTKYNLTSCVEIKNMYNSKLVPMIVPNYISMLVSLVSNNISYVPIQTFYNVMNMHLSYFVNELHINNNIHLSSYVQYLQLTINQTTTTTTTTVNTATDNDTTSKKQQKIGPAQWIHYATVGSTTTSTTDDTTRTGNNNKNDNTMTSTTEEDKEL